jgi:hypothetical protein
MVVLSVQVMIQFEPPHFTTQVKIEWEKEAKRSGFLRGRSYEA